MSVLRTVLALFLVAYSLSPLRAELFDDSAKQATRAATPVNAQSYLVDTGARLVLPSRDVSRVALTDDKIYIQFERPLRATERAELMAAGIVFYETLAPFTYLVAVPGDAVQTLSGHPLFVGVASVLPADKMTAALYFDEIPLHARRAQDRIAVFVRFYRDVPFKSAVGLLDELDIEIDNRKTYLFGQKIEVEATREQILDASASPLVQSVTEVGPPPQTDNQTAASLSFVNLVNIPPWALQGDGINIGIWDGGMVRNTHVDLTGRVTIRDTIRFCSQPNAPRSSTNTPCTQNSDCPTNAICTAFSDHATHVAGTMMSSGGSLASTTGMAPGSVALFSYNYLGSIETEMRNSVTSDGIHLSQNSYGISRGWGGSPPVNSGDGATFGVYNSLSSAWDELVRETDLLIMKSAGNEGNDCQAGGTPSNPSSLCDGVLGSPSDGFRYDIISDRDLSKNIITVGSIDPSLTKSAFSSTGPPDDGRIKPDLVAVGSNLNSSCSLSNSDLCVKSGTSMSTPVVSGVSALLIERWQDFHASSGRVPNAPPPELIKALLIHDATDLGRTGPDYAYGHGLVNALLSVTTLESPNAAGTSADVPNKHRIGFVDTGEILEFHMTAPPEGADDVKVTLVWTDLEGASASVVRYCNYAYGAQQCTSDADCPGAICEPAPCGASQPCHLKNDLAALLHTPEPERAVVGLAYRGPGLANPTGATVWGNFHNRSDSVEVLRPGSFDDGGNYIITVEGMSVSEGPQRFALVANYPLTFFPPNDDFGDAQTLPMLVPADPSKDDCLTGADPCPAEIYPHNAWNAVNFDAGTESGEPTFSSRQRHSVWFHWSPSQSGIATFDTAGADFDTMVGAYTGSAVNALTTLDQNDDTYGRQSEVTFPALAGTNYFIAVSGWESSTGNDNSMGTFPLNYHLVPSVCGNNIMEPGEDCDDGNTSNGDCCSASCTLEPSGSSCDLDGSVCSVDRCDGTGVCAFQSALSCDDSNVCTDDSCDAILGCMTSFNTAPCDSDSSVCTVDRCDGTGVCAFESALSCNDGNVCTDDSCDAVLGCTTVNNSGPCEDGLDCTIGDTCSAGTCQGGPPPNCDDMNTCTADSCQQGWNCVNAPQTVLVLEAQTIDSIATFAATENIRAGGGFIVVPGGNLTFEAPSIMLDADFAVRQGATASFGSTGGICPVGAASCAHDVCATGVTLDPNCSACAAAVCAADSYCCEVTWDNICTGAVPQTCPQSCAAN